MGRVQYVQVEWLKKMHKVIMHGSTVVRCGVKLSVSISCQEGC